MAKKDRTGSDSVGAGSAVAEREKRVSNRSGDGDRDKKSGSAPAGTRNDIGGPVGGIYKPGQGYHTRMWTAVGFGTLVVWFVAFLWQKLTVLPYTGSTTLIIQVGVAVAVIGVFSFFGYRLLGRSPKVNDFLIATEGEMKKVNWTSRKEIIGSTKVVIFVLIAMSILLFVVDILFMFLFSWMGVLKGRSLIELIFGGGAA